MEMWYGARGVFDPTFDGWAAFVTRHGIDGVNEIISLDSDLNRDLLELDFDKLPLEEWEFVVIDNSFHTGFFKTPAFVLERLEPRGPFNFLAIAKEPTAEIIDPAGFELAGYELLNSPYETSLRFYDDFEFPTLNEVGLINDFKTAVEFRGRLRVKKIPGDFSIFAVWRHKTIGRNASLVGESPSI